MKEANQMEEDWRHRLTEGYHKLALSVQSLAVEGESREKRLERVETALTGNGASLKSQVAVIENRLSSMEKDLHSHTKSDTSLAVAREGSRAVIVAAWIGGIVTFLAAVASLIIALARI